MDQRAGNLCNRLWDSQEKANCINRFYNSWFDGSVMTLCERFYDEREISSCLTSGENRTFDTRALNMCSRLYDADEMSSCFQAIDGKTYEQVELTACQYEYGSDLAPCLSRLGTSRNGGFFDNGINNPNIGNTIEEVLTDAIDRMLRDLLLGDNSYVNNRRSTQEYCRIENSSGRLIGETSVEDLQRFGQRYASESGECVVTNIYNRQRTRTLYNSRGQIVGERLTERETNDLKSGHRCRVAICMVEQNTSYNDTPTYRPTPTWSTY